jgi:hypothetical protein
MGVISGASTASAMDSAQQQADAQEAQANAERQAAEYNATVERNNAASAREATTRREAQQRYQSELLAGRNAAIAAESGVGMDGSNWDFMRQNAVQGELEALNIRFTGETQAQGLLAKAQQYDMHRVAAARSAAEARRAGKTAVRAAAIKGVSNFVSMGMTSGAWGGGVKPTTMSGG